MTSGKNAAHVVWQMPYREDHMDFHCLHCDDHLGVELPVGMTTIIEVMAAFGRVHRRCKQTERGLRIARDKLLQALRERAWRC